MHCEIDLWCILLGVCLCVCLCEVCVCLKQCAYHQKNMQQYNRIIEQQKSIKCFSVVSYSPFIVMFSHTHIFHMAYIQKEVREKFCWTKLGVHVYDFYSFLLGYYYISTKIM